MLSARTRATYAADWALFTDWCAATDTTALPADPRTVVDFLTGCPAAAATLRCRVAAIDHHHTAHGHERPGESVAVRAALGRPTGEPFHPTERNRDAVEAALRGLPSHGWTAGMFGRRDRALLVLSQLAGVPYRHLATLTAGDIHIEEGVATIRSPAGEWTLRPADDAVLCGPCAVVRWLKILDLAVTKPSTKTIARALKKAAAVDHRSPHVCRHRAGPRRGDARSCRCCRRSTNGAPYPSHCNASPRTRCPAAPGTSSPGTSAPTATCPSTPTRNRTCPRRRHRRSPSQRAGTAYDAADAAAAWDRRRRDLDDLAGIIDVLTDVERRADELNRRAAELVEDWL